MLVPVVRNRLETAPVEGLGNEPVSGPDSSSLAPLRVERLAPLRVERDFDWDPIAGLGLLLPQLRGILRVRVERSPRRVLHRSPRRHRPQGSAPMPLPGVEPAAQPLAAPGELEEAEGSDEQCSARVGHRPGEFKRPARSGHLRFTWPTFFARSSWGSGGKPIKPSIFPSVNRRMASAAGFSIQSISFRGSRPTCAAMLAVKRCRAEPSVVTATFLPLKSRIERMRSLPNSSKHPT